MIKEIDVFKITCEQGANILLKKVEESNNVKVYTFELSWILANVESDFKFSFLWFVPMVSLMYRWNTQLKNDRHIPMNHTNMVDSMISKNAPLDSYYDGRGINKYTWALDEAVQLVSFSGAANENDGSLCCRIDIPVSQYTNKFSAQIKLRIDSRPIPLYEAINSVATWWEEECGLTALQVPYFAKEPLYSSWYSFHSGISSKIIEEECVRAKELGFDICIVDDGWQIEKGKNGYVNCGDWEPSVDKFHDMANHIEKIHQLGMKYLLWFCVPYIGYQAKSFDRFKDMLLRAPSREEQEKNTFISPVLDPRYKAVREHLINIYVDRLKKWKFDGIKLDFIDRWCYSPDNAPYNEKMDIPALQDAVNVFMTELVEKFHDVKPDILIEFRQFYVGPHMRKFGNMFRVNDCPNDHISNRVGVLDLRMLMRNSAVHSDMLMWSESENPETAALQIIGIMYGTMQYSAKLETLSENMKKMTLFWLEFLKKHRELLLENPIEVYEPHLLYTWVKSTRNDESIVTVYSIDKCVECTPVSTIYIVNGAMSERVIFELDGKYNLVEFDCYGNIKREVENVSYKGINSEKVSIGGMLVLNKD